MIPKIPKREAAPARLTKSRYDSGFLSQAIDKLNENIADMAPGPTLYVVPNESFAKDYSRLRITPMIEESERLKSKISEAK